MEDGGHDVQDNRKDAMDLPTNPILEHKYTIFQKTSFYSVKILSTFRQFWRDERLADMKEVSPMNTRSEDAKRANMLRT